MFFGPLAPFSDFGLVFRSPVKNTFWEPLLVLLFGLLSKHILGVAVLFFGPLSEHILGVTFPLWSCYSAPCPQAGLHDHDGGYGLHDHNGSWSRKGPVFRTTSNLI